MTELTDDELIARVLELDENRGWPFTEMSPKERCQRWIEVLNLAIYAPDLAHRLQKSNEEIKRLTKTKLSPTERARQLGFDISKVREDHSELDLITGKRFDKE